MRYILQNLLRGQVTQYQKGLVDDIAHNFDLRFTQEQSLPTHFTLKYHFETDNIEEIENLLQSFTRSHTKQLVSVGGFGHFDDRVIFIPVALSQSAREVFVDLVKSLKQISWMPWGEFDGDRLHFHSTIAEKCQGKFEEVWSYLQGRDAHFETYFDNVSILRQVGVTPNNVSKWDVYKTFELN